MALRHEAEAEEVRSSPALSSVVSSIRRFEVEEVVHVCDIARLRVSWGSHQGRGSKSKSKKNGDDGKRTPGSKLQSEENAQSTMHKTDMNRHKKRLERKIDGKVGKVWRWEICWST